MFSQSGFASALLFAPSTKDELQSAVDLWCADKKTALKKYGDINSWNVSKITDMSELFKGKEEFNSDIGSWDVSNVTTMNGMFFWATLFNQDIGSWDVSHVNDMSCMFEYCNIIEEYKPK